MPIIEAKQIKKSYAKKHGLERVEVIHGIDLSIEPGESVGYVGMNGAGKSTTIKMLTGLIPPTEGTISVLGMNPFRQRKEYVRNIGVVFGQRNQLLWDLPVEETFLFHKKIFHVSDTDYKNRMILFSELLELDKLLNARSLTLSLGQRMKCNLALSLLHGPKILFLDEATIGLDVLVKKDIHNILQHQVKDLGTTLLFTSHDMKDISQICKRIIVLDKGTIVEDMQLDDFTEKYGGRRTVTIEVSNSDVMQKLDKICKELLEDKIDVTRADETIGQFQMVFQEKILPVPILMEALYANKIPIAQINIEKDQLEDAIAKIYGKEKMEYF